MEKTTMELAERTEEIGVGLEVAEPEGVETEMVPLNYQAALASFEEEERQEILALADKIDVTQIEKVMNYGSKPLRDTFEQSGAFLKKERGSTADQEVISRVIELSKKTSESQDEFNNLLELKEPNFVEKLVMKLFSSSKNTGSRTEKLQNSAKTSYMLLAELQNSFEEWLELLYNAMTDIEESAISDSEAIVLLEKYIIAGKFAEERIQKELEEIQKQYQATGLQKYANSYRIMKEGYNHFKTKMMNLEQSRGLYYLSIAQLMLIKETNTSMQATIHTQKDNFIATFGQQLRNGIVNAKNKEVLRGQKAVVKLGDELIKDVSETVANTAVEAKKAMYQGFYSLEAAEKAFTFVKNACNDIEKVETEMLPKMKEKTERIECLIEELKPYINPVETTTETLKIETSSNKAPSTGGGGDLNF